MIPMCATSGTFYGHKAIEYIDNGQKPEPRVDFLMDEIEGEDIPEVDDLILNIGTDDYPDGCFYRVNNVDENNIIETTRLTLQGTGGGGSSSGPVIGGENFSFNLIGSAKKVFASTATSMDFIFKCNYLGTDTENHITQVSFVKSGETEPFYVYNKQMAFNEQHTIDLISCKDLFNSTTTTVYVYATDTYGTQKQQKITI